MRTAESPRGSRSERRPANPVATASMPVVVCGIDDPVADGAVLGFAAELVERIAGRLVLAHVQPPPVLALEPQIAYAAGHPDSGCSLRSVARRLARLAANAGIAPTTKLEVGFGDLEERLLATARREQAALIVIGSHAASRSGRTGSLAPRLIERATCPVLVLPPSHAPAAYATGIDWSQTPLIRGAGCPVPSAAAAALGNNQGVPAPPRAGCLKSVNKVPATLDRLSRYRLAGEVGRISYVR